MVWDELHEVGISAKSWESYNSRVERGGETDGKVIKRATRSIRRMTVIVVVVDVAWQLKGWRTVLYLKASK